MYISYIQQPCHCHALIILQPSQYIVSAEIFTADVNVFMTFKGLYFPVKNLYTLFLRNIIPRHGHSFAAFH